MLQFTCRSLTGSGRLREVIALRELTVPRSDDWDLVHQNIMTNHSGMVFDVCKRLCSSSVALLFVPCRIVFHVGIKS